MAKRSKVPSAAPIERVANPYIAKIRAAFARKDEVTLEVTLEVGHWLTVAKADLPHGEFERMVDHELGFGSRQARNYMQVAGYHRFSNRKHASDLPEAVNTLTVLTGLSDEAFERHLASQKIHRNMTRGDALALVKGEQQRLPLDDEGLPLSTLGSGFDRVIEYDVLAPPWNKQEDTSRKMIDEIAASCRKLKQLAPHIAEAGVPEKFAAEVTRMEGRIANHAEQYRQTMESIKALLRLADDSLRHAPED